MTTTPGTGLPSNVTVPLTSAAGYNFPHPVVADSSSGPSPTSNCRELILGRINRFASGIGRQRLVDVDQINRIWR